MTYNQFSSYALTGLSASVKNFVDNNSNATNSEVSLYPNKFDVFVNKENSSIGSFAITEQHTLDQINGGVLYLDHRPSVDVTGGVSSFVISDGGIVDTTQTDIYSNTIQFTVLPIASPFTVSYSASSDKVQDSHINALQNTLMNVQSALGIKSTIDGQGTGLISMPLVVNASIANLTDLQSFQNLVPNIVCPAHLSSNFKIGTTNVVGVPGYGTGVTIYIGNNSAVSRDSVWIDADTFTLATTNGLAGNPGGTYNIGTTTGDSVNMSGCLTVASQSTIGAPGGALGVVDTTVPTGASVFYSEAMLRVHGGIWFGNGLSGNGAITFVTTTGQAVDVQGNLIATTLDVSTTSQFHGESTFLNTVDAQYPGQYTTDNDIVLNTKPNLTPSKIDGLDPSYAQHAIDNPAIDNKIVQSIRTPIDFNNSTPYPSGYKQHPVYGFKMYPMIGGWTYTGLVAYEKAQTGAYKNIVLLNSSLTAIGTNAQSGVASYSGSNIGGGSLNYGDYCTGLFNPGDTYIEFKGLTAADDYIYPIYYHQAYLSSTTVTGLNLYLAADDTALQNSIAGKKYRIFQPANAPLNHLSGNFSTPSAPLGVVGNLSTDDYPNTSVNVVTDKSWIGGSNVSNNYAQYKKITSTSSVSLSDALSKSIANATGTSLSATGVAYIYVAGSETNNTQETSLQLRASPTPFGIATTQVQNGTPKLTPGQHIAVGEIVASTNDGASWTLVESASYRQDGIYDSCWIPLVDYRKTAAQIPSSLGRCLPFYTSTASSSTNHDGSADSYIYQWFVEHNLGPVESFANIDFKVYIAAYGTSFDTNQVASGSTDNAIFKMSSKGGQNLWTQYPGKYAATHAFYKAPSGQRGFLKDITDQCEMIYNDTRFACFGSNISTVDLAGQNNRLAQYIRVIIKKS
jgi:hypothetical protein